ncbi:hypothetical protein SELMODRAFT_440940 [Selaginella moellendorffii]|uniref:60S ribosomal protein L18a-like protein n=1 Tax=Selaginella moellendorffii TaxID=88036 RepID=D8RFL0_SELML|nr:60S ribosomal protein L18a-like protein [Selaginella moellendorffii]EFJ28884.1 hypothetical protein SELMODRAFT_440940 [Selaginella moellendorffii]|eukprot:XP_002969760.1 60S ribosomal protein L18a-like protein [Selaginella moellendorffii]
MTASGPKNEEGGEQRHLQGGTQLGVPAYYGTFQGNPSFPQPVHPSQYEQQQQQQQQEYHPGYVSSQGYERIDHYQHHDRLPCCGLGIGWCLFILGFLTLSLPWFVGAFIFFCIKTDAREHVGLAACAIAALMALLVGGSKGIHMW